MAEIEISYEKSDNYQLIPVAGVWGGVTPQGMIAADLFMERPTPPTTSVLTIGNNGEILSEAPSGIKQKFTREILVGLVLQPEMAKAVAEWLLTKVAELEKLTVKK